MSDDRNLLHDLAQRILSQDSKVADRARSFRPRAEMQPAVEAVQEKMGVATESAGGGSDDQLALETIVVKTGRPVLLVEKDDYRLEGPESEIWAERLNVVSVRKALQRILPAIGRVEVKGHPALTWVGTAWLVADDVLVTNRHVAEEFGLRSGDKFVFKKGAGDRMQASIDFKEALNGPEPNEFQVLDILHIEPDDGPDLAFLRVNPKSLVGRPLAGKLIFGSGNPAKGQFVATIGYPAADSRVPDQDLVRRLFGDVYNVKRLAPGQLLQPRDGLVLHDCSTLGGNSGSPVVDLQTGEAVGLHFSGLFLRENRGVPAAVIKERLTNIGRRPIVPVSGNVSEQKPAPMKPDLQQTVGGLQTIRLNVSVPIEITVRVGDVKVGDTPATPASGAGSGASVEAAVGAARQMVGGSPSVLTVRDGFVFKDGWITDQPAIVVVVRDTEAPAPAELGIPDQIEGFPVVVRPAGPSDYLESRDDLMATLEGLPRTTYTPPDDVTLEEVDDEMKVVCHFCPDAGWPTLRDFLSETKKRLTIGMYDFTAPHIIDGVLSAVDRQPRKLKLVMQAGESLGGGTKKNDVKEEKTIDEYGEKLGDRFQFIPASIGKDHRFASAYHIKVAVRDGSAFWLSSGNWQSSNQPDHEIAVASDGWNLLMKHNREWNVVIENRELAAQFEAFLRHDFDQAEADAGAEAPAIPELAFLVEEAPELEKVPSGTPTYFKPLELDRQVRVQPLLTPDNYSTKVLELIESAEEQILFQNQSFSILDEDKNDSRYAALFDALLAKQKAGVDVRIIIRGEFDAEKAVEKLKKHGFDTERIRLQDRCHTKGIIVDKKVVLVGSHNWTNQGALVNRDASLIFHDEEIAKYFAEGFWFDWKKLARKSVAGQRRVRVSDGRESPPAGMVAVPWQEVLFG